MRGANHTIVGFCSKELGFIVGAHFDSSCNQQVFAECILRLKDIVTARGPQKRRLIVLDSVPFHKTQMIRLLEDEHFKIVYLPPYSPAWNPIELCWSWLSWKIAHLLQDAGNTTQVVGNSITMAIGEMMFTEHGKHIVEQYVNHCHKVYQISILNDGWLFFDKVSESDEELAELVGEYNAVHPSAPLNLSGFGVQVQRSIT
eukprot:ANDGO_03856.mRNA.1 hypothetical protein